jgi:hypothetical protein
MTPPSAVYRRRSTPCDTRGMDDEKRASMDEGERPRLISGDRDAGPWFHDDGTRCDVFLAPRATPYPPLLTRWWCTEHQSHLTAARRMTRPAEQSGETS